MTYKEVKRKYEDKSLELGCENIFIHTTFEDNDDKVFVFKRDYNQYKTLLYPALLVIIPRKDYNLTKYDNLDNVKLYKIGPEVEFEREVSTDGFVTGYVLNYKKQSEMIEEKTDDPRKDWEVKQNSIDSLDTDQDGNRPYNKLTKKEYAAIHLGLPISGTNWLDEMIKIKN